MAYFVGLDSGGTKTQCWLGDETRVLGKAVCGTVKSTRVSREVATARMRGLLREVEAASGVALEEVSRTCVGISGYSIPEVREWAARVVGECVGGEVEVCGDDEIALDAAFRGGPGILVIGGTGAIVLGRCPGGERFTAGGWGPAIGDEGSGYWIGREAVRKIFRAYDEGVETTMFEAIRQAWGAEDLGGMLGVANARPGPDFAALTPVVVRCAEAGDEMAQRLLAKAGNELGKQVAIVWKKMQAVGEARFDREVVVAFTGSVVEKIGWVRRRMTERVGEDCPGLRLAEAAVDSMEGAMWRARRLGAGLVRSRTES